MSTKSENFTNRSRPSRRSNLYLVGPQCSGKTTLLNALRALYSDHNPASQDIDKPFIIEEAARLIMQEEGFQATDLCDSVRSLELQMRILRRQDQTEEQMRDQWFFADWLPLDTLVYAKEYTGIDALKTLAQTEEWARSRSRMQHATVVVCEAGNVEWLSADSIRIAYRDASEWKALNGAFFDLLRECGIPYSVLSHAIKDLGQRVALVSRFLENDKSRLYMEPVSL
ncbi:hypothetical protein AG0111_0g11721 [Alternaria gaisen]|uniref:Uncharacterized protein n=1 Tax=Alternaria gaisen TaxID=167740 RepID=A0ACB6F6W7_9PLEO|nr:hypothetical protein AG0111_0g11721 [Alternaria gaisen]